VSEEAQAGVNLEVDEDAEEVNVEVTSLGNADYVTLGGSVDDSDLGSDYSGSYIDGTAEANNVAMEVGDTATLTESTGLDSASGTVTAIAVIEEDGTETQVASEEYNFN
jgi:hypothetical protein